MLIKVLDVDADFDLQPYLPEEPGEGEQPNLHRIHKKWFVGYLARFGRHFTPLQLYPQDKVDLKDRLADIVIDDSSYIPICLQTQGTPRLLLPQCCTYSKYGSHIGIPSTKVARSLKEHSGRSGAAQLAACKAASFKPVHHEQRKTPQAASTRKNQVQPTGQHRDEKFEDSRQPNKGHAEDKPIGQKFPLVKFPHPKQSSHQTGNPPQRKGQELASRPSTHHCSHKARSAYTNSSRLGQELPANDKTRSACTNSNPRHQKLNCPSAYTKMTHFFKNSQQTKRRPAPLPAKTTTIHSAKNSRL